jgi:hypothetical protein
VSRRVLHGTLGLLVPAAWRASTKTRVPDRRSRRPYAAFAQVRALLTRVSSDDPFVAFGSPVAPERLLLHERGPPADFSGKLGSSFYRRKRSDSRPPMNLVVALTDRNRWPRTALVAGPAALVATTFRAANRNHLAPPAVASNCRRRLF